MSSQSPKRMYGTGNNFVIIDSRSINNLNWNYREIANQNGCDQIIVITNSSAADCFMHIYNADGGEVEMCGNAARCVGYLIMSEKSTEYATIELVNKRILECFKVGGRSIKVNMGKPLFKWHEIPLSAKCDPLHLPIELEMLKDPVAVNIGNPHMVFFVDNISEIPLQSLGPKLEKHTLFPKKVNVNIAQVEKSGEISLRVWERGTGITASCGSAACAALIASVLRGYLITRQTSVNLPGGKLLIEWPDNIFMTGDIGFL
ncbi:Diaminopimelate epimerase [Wolbachia endosymbiont strain TRS of Brugia malayi]|uniref:Diaminopimelate epimerase n=1 Tax=Wolbachia sp. subsp. Brugia malayi (strain TRS) TaxID=292805 RepID=DAPF_WOLTR|nr:diaminopimelate epimerase [Wolbachia endosymbiont of Brugia malayi]Q5GSB8.1 RecName: Full=Diaminopimelate epimerase; Short=DAP epimerase; AltName: Full=PLP-independent amino acid racemase [Wolbachia endosymbiont strain TRS of Brugia malayi]AAW71106.1 Diaminopimelate epimerase [Wolbachia endosymbiont strain TRS of Brugia malayi]